MSTPNRGIPYVVEGALDNAAAVNLALDQIDVKFVPIVIAMDLSAPPGSPANGDTYVVAATGSGAWSGWTNRIARYRSEGTFWQSYLPEEVGLVLNQDDGLLWVWDFDSEWVQPAPEGESAPPPVVTESGSSLLATPGNAGNYTRFGDSNPTYEFNTSETYVVGDEYHGRFVGGSELTLVAGGSMSLNAPYGGTLVIPPGGTFTVKIVASNQADVFGVTVPA